MNKIIDPLFMILYPISPKELLVLYRPEDGVVDTNRILTDEETHILNSYQFQQTDDIIAFHDRSQIDFDKFKNQYGMLNKCLREVPIENSEDCVLIPHTIQGFHFDYDYGIRRIINPKKQTLDYMTEYAVKTNDHSLKRNLIEYGIEDFTFSLLKSRFLFYLPFRVLQSHRFFRRVFRAIKPSVKVWYR